MSFKPETLAAAKKEKGNEIGPATVTLDISIFPEFQDKIRPVHVGESSIWLVNGKKNIL